MEEINHTNTENIVCPYCGHIDINSWEANQDYDENYECSNCYKDFTMERVIDVTYNTHKNDN